MHAPGFMVMKKPQEGTREIGSPMKSSVPTCARVCVYMFARV